MAQLSYTGWCNRKNSRFAGCEKCAFWNINVFVLFPCTLQFIRKSYHALLKFLKTLLYFLSTLGNGPILKEIASLLPKTMYGIRKYFQRQSDFSEYVVCPQCYHLYSVSECIIKNACGEESKICDHIEFPNHSQWTRRRKCGALLMKRVKINGKLKLVPRKIYLYHNIIHSLTDMVRRPEFLTKCEHWRDRPKKNSCNEFWVEPCGKIYIK